MRDALRNLILAALTVAAAATPARAAFEDIEVSPQARGRGGASLASLSDPYAALHNPAALAWARGSAAASYVQPFGLDFATQNVVTGAGRLPGRAGGAGLSWREFGVEYQGQRLLRETTISFAHGFGLLQDRQSELAFGWGVDWYSLDFGTSITGLDPGRASVLGFHLGALATVRERTRVGFAVRNFNHPAIGDRDKEELRERVAVGVAYAPYPGVETSLDLSNELGESLQWRGGTEFEVSSALVLRAGVRTEPSAVSAGLGLRLAGFVLDYGFSTGGVLGETHQVGISATLPGRAPERP
jgi:hypothetical protein